MPQLDTLEGTSLFKISMAWSFVCSIRSVQGCQAQVQDYFLAVSSQAASSDVRQLGLPPNG